MVQSEDAPASDVFVSRRMPFSAQHIKAARLHLQKHDPVMKRLLKRIGPFTGKTTRHRFGTLVKSIVSQQISTSAARTIHGRLNDLVNGQTGASASRNFKIEPEDLIRYSIEELREAGISKQKATYLLDLATKVNTQVIDLSGIHRLQDEEAIEVLTEVKGIGRWTAQMFLMFCLGRMDILPVDDLGIKNAIATEYRLKELPDKATIETIASPWRPYASVASWYLWRSTDTNAQ